MADAQVTVDALLASTAIRDLITSADYRTDVLTELYDWAEDLKHAVQDELKASKRCEVLQPGRCECLMPVGFRKNGMGMETHDDEELEVRWRCKLSSF